MMGRDGDGRRGLVPGVMGWLAVLVLLPGVGASAEPEGGDAPWTRAEVIEQFQDVRIVPRQGAFLFLGGGEFPELVWEQPFLVRYLWGPAPLEVQWFDESAEPVDEPAESGRYVAYVESQPPDAPLIRRSLTFYALEREAADRMMAESARQAASPMLPGVPDAAREAYGAEIQRFMRQMVLQAMAEREEAGILLAALGEYDADAPPEPPFDAPAVQHQEHQLAVKRQVLGMAEREDPLEPPRLRDQPAPVLREGTPTEAGLDESLPRELREVCATWLEEGGEPFTIVLARDGVVVFHEAFGEGDDGEAVSRDTAYPLFSLTKSVTGIMLAQFLDQGLLELDEPLGEVLPDLPTEGENVLTVRRCMMHVSGLSGHGRWGGLNNVWLENVIANGMEAMPAKYQYSGTAYDLVGSAMAMLTGRSVPRLFHEQLFEPLEMKNARITDLGSGGHLRAIDLAKLGQLLLNEGAYGERTYFSPETAKLLLPERYDEHFPEIETNQVDYGLGLRWAGRPHPQAGEGDVPEEATIFSDRTLGHGSFSGTVWRVDPENRIVLAVGRFGRGEDHGEHLDRLMMTIRDALE